MRHDIKSVLECVLNLHERYGESKTAGKSDDFFYRVFNESPSEVSQLYLYILNMKINVYGYIYSKADDTFNDAIFAVIKKTICGFDENRANNFDGFVRVIFKNSLKDIIRKERNIKCQSLDETQYSDDGDIVENQIEDPNTNYRPEEALIISENEIQEKNFQNIRTELVEKIYILMADISNTQIKMYEGSKRYCYAPLFFTDRMYILMNINFNSENLIKKHNKSLCRATSFKFASYFTTKECNTLYDFKSANYKPLSEITGNSNDVGPCGNIDGIMKNYLSLNYKVYISYIKNETGKSVSTAAITQQLNKNRSMFENVDGFEELNKIYTKISANH